MNVLSLFDGMSCGRRIDENNTRQDYKTEIPIRQFLECRKDNKTNCITTVGKDNIVVYEKKERQPLNGTKYRYLSRNEMERLQTIPINYTSAVSVNQSLKLLGNGWTVDVIAHIFKNIPH